jgi:hypothetical protein
VNKHIKKLTTCLKHTLYDFLEIDLSIMFQSIDRQWSLSQIAFSIHITYYTPKNIDDFDIFFRNIAEQMLREQTIATCVSNITGCLIGSTSKLDKYSRAWPNLEQAFVFDRNRIYTNIILQRILSLHSPFDVDTSFSLYDLQQSKIMMVTYDGFLSARSVSICSISMANSSTSVSF